MNWRFGGMPVILISAASCGSFDEARIDVPAGQSVQPQYVAVLEDGSAESVKGVDLEFKLHPPGGSPLEGEIDETSMTEGPDNTFTWTAPQVPLGTRLEGTWTGRLRPVLSFADRTETRTRQAHVGHDVRLVGLALRDGDQELPLFQTSAAQLQGCRVIDAGEAFEALVLADNPSFTAVPQATVRVNVSPQGAGSVSPATLTQTASLPAEAGQTGIVLGPFVPTVQGGLVAFDISAQFEDNALDFAPANDAISAQQSAATGNPGCFDDAGQLQRELCQVCLIVEPG